MKTLIKRSLILALALVFSLCLTAAAQTLTDREFLEQVLVPAAAASREDRFTAEELQAIKKKAEEQGYPLPEGLALRLEARYGDYKAEVLRAAMAGRLGWETSTWDLADQIWFEDQSIKVGLISAQYIPRPQPGDLAQQEALDIAIKAIQSQFGEQADLRDRGLWRLYLHYVKMAEGPEEGQRVWDFAFFPLQLGWHNYHVLIRYDGKLLSCRQEQEHSADSMNPFEVEGHYLQVHGPMSAWDYDTWQAFKRDLKAALGSVQGEGHQSSLPVFLMIQHLRPTADHLPREQAITLAAAHPDAPSDVDLLRSSALLLLDEETPVWKVRLLPQVPPPERALPFLVELDATTGALRAARQADADNYNPHRDYQLDSYMGIGQLPTQPPQPTPRPDGKPWYWYADRLPAYFWEEMDALFAQGEKEDLAQKWEQAYGSQLELWPLTAQAFAFLTWYNVGGVEGTVAGLPDEQDIKPEEAIAIAKKALMDQGMDPKALEAASPGVSFYYTEESPGTHMYAVRFFTITGQDYALLEVVDLDARDGAVIGIGGNG